MASFQQRTDDLYRLKTRNLVYQNVDGSYPGKGAIAFAKDTVGSVSWSPVTADASGNLTVPGTTSLGFNGSVTVDGVTGILNAANNVNVQGNLNTAAMTTNALNLSNTTTPTVVSQLIDSNYKGNEALMWYNANNQAEPISGWAATLAPAPFVFRKVDISGLTGATRTLANNMNFLLELFQSRVCFVNALSSSTAFAAVFNTTVAIKFTIKDGGNVTYPFTVIQTGNMSQAIEYSVLAASIKTAWNNTYTAVQDKFFTTFNSSTNVFDISAAPGYSFNYDDVSTNGTGQLYFNHIGFPTWTPNTYITKLSTTILGDIAVPLPPTPAAPSVSVNGLLARSCTIVIPQPQILPNPVQRACIYWCVSGSAFPPYPVGVIPIGTTPYVITGLTPSTNYKIAISYRNAYDESALSSSLSITTPFAPAFSSYALSEEPVIASDGGGGIYSVDITLDPNWLSTPSYGVSPANYTKQYANNVKFTVATLFSAIYTSTLSDLTSVRQIQSITLDFYAGTNASPTDARFFVGGNPNRNIIYAPDEATVEPLYDGDRYGVGGQMTIYPDVDGIDMIREIFNATADDSIDTSKNIVFGWFSARNGGIRNCEVIGFTVVYTA
jgi:hypothetical protein